MGFRLKYAGSISSSRLSACLLRVYQNAQQEIQKPDTSPLFQDYAYSWYNTYKIPKLRSATAHQYIKLLENHLVPFFFGKHLGEIVSSDIQALYNQKNDEGLSKSSTHTMKVILNQIFCSAIEDKLVHDNPVSSKRLTLPTKRAEKGALSEEDLAGIIASLPELELKDRRFLALLIYTGVRRREALGLRWEDIDWERRLIRIERTASYIDNDTYVDVPKTAISVRDVPLFDALSEILTPSKEREDTLLEMEYRQLLNLLLLNVEKNWQNN